MTMSLLQEVLPALCRPAAITEEVIPLTSDRRYDAREPLGVQRFPVTVFILGISAHNFLSLTSRVFSHTDDNNAHTK